MTWLRRDRYSLLAALDDDMPWGSGIVCSPSSGCMEAAALCGSVIHHFPRPPVYWNVGPGRGAEVGGGERRCGRRELIADQKASNRRCGEVQIVCKAALD